MTLTNLVISCHSYLDNYQVSSISDKCNRLELKTLLYKDKTRAHFLDSLVCIMLIFSSVFIFRKIINKCEITTIDLTCGQKHFPRLDDFTRTDNLEIAKNRLKFWTLSPKKISLENNIHSPRYL